MDLAVPRTIFKAASLSLAFKSSIFSVAILMACSKVNLPTLSRFGTPDPFSIPTSFLINSATGGFLSMKVKDLLLFSAKETEILRPEHHRDSE